MRGASLPPPAEEARRLRSRRSSSSRRPICGPASSGRLPDDLLYHTLPYLVVYADTMLIHGVGRRAPPLQSPSTVPGEGLELNAPPPNAGE